MSNFKIYFNMEEKKKKMIISFTYNNSNLVKYYGNVLSIINVNKKKLIKSFSITNN